MAFNPDEYVAKQMATPEVPQGTGGFNPDAYIANHLSETNSQESISNATSPKNPIEFMRRQTAFANAAVDERKKGRISLNELGSSGAVIDSVKKDLAENGVKAIPASLAKIFATAYGSVAETTEGVPAVIIDKLMQGKIPTLEDFKNQTTSKRSELGDPIVRAGLGETSGKLGGLALAGALDPMASGTTMTRQAALGLGKKAAATPALKFVEELILKGGHHMPEAAVDYLNKTGYQAVTAKNLAEGAPEKLGNTLIKLTEGVGSRATKAMQGFESQAVRPMSLQDNIGVINKVKDAIAPARGSKEYIRIARLIDRYGKDPDLSEQRLFNLVQDLKKEDSWVAAKAVEAATTQLQAVSPKYKAGSALYKDASDLSRAQEDLVKTSELQGKKTVTKNTPFMNYFDTPETVLNPASRSTKDYTQTLGKYVSANTAQNVEKSIKELSAVNGMGGRFPRLFGVTVGGGVLAAGRQANVNATVRAVVGASMIALGSPRVAIKVAGGLANAVRNEPTPMARFLATKIPNETARNILTGAFNAGLSEATVKPLREGASQ